PVHPLAALVPLLGLEAQRSDWPRIKAAQPDRLPGLLAVTVGTVLDPGERCVDLGDKLPMTVTGPEFQRPVSLCRSPVGKVGVVIGVFMQTHQGFAGLPQDLFFPSKKFPPEVLSLPLIHERLVFRRPV